MWRELAPDVWLGRYTAGHLPCHTLAWKMANGQYLVYSPGPDLLENFQEEIKGEVGVIVAPSSYHTLGIIAWHHAYPRSMVVAGKAAIKRVQQKTEIALQPLKDVPKMWMKNFSLVEVPHNRIGEVWIEGQMAGVSTWVVCDAFFNMKTPNSLIGKFMQTLFKSGPGLKISKLYSWLGVSNKSEMNHWLTQELKISQPTQLIPCHGEVIKDAMLTEQLQKVVDEAF
jgi:hypothetical protein